jgi:hypothetical protein
MLEPVVTPVSPVVDVVAAVPVRPSALRSPDSPEPDEAGVARLCSIWEISPDSDACEVPAAVPVAWVTAALCAADPAGLATCGAAVNGVTWVAAAEFAA